MGPDILTKLNCPSCRICHTRHHLVFESVDYHAVEWLRAFSTLKDLPPAFSGRGESGHAEGGDG